MTATVRARAIELGAQTITYPWNVGELIERRRAQCCCQRLPDCRWAQIVEGAEG